MNGTQRSSGTQWSNCVNAEQKGCVPLMAQRDSKHRQGHLLLGGGFHVANLQEKTNNAVLLTTAAGTVLAAGQTPGCGPDHPEVKAEPRTSSLGLRTSCFIPRERATQMPLCTDTHVHNHEPLTAPCTCSQNTKPRH